MVADIARKSEMRGESRLDSYMELFLMGVGCSLGGGRRASRRVAAFAKCPSVLLPAPQKLVQSPLQRERYPKPLATQLGCHASPEVIVRACTSVDLNTWSIGLGNGDWLGNPDTDTCCGKIGSGRARGLVGEDEVLDEEGC